FFCKHQECRSIEVMEDILIGDPERTVLVRLSDVCAATSILESEEARALKREFMEYACDFSSQMLNTVSKKTA
ncbi:MAG: hypothetical protein Q8R28_12505, partial [Dehalococcoidia bacterium]|nr:hypothetical protein [Dehalococcoidia bacterium]